MGGDIYGGNYWSVYCFVFGSNNGLLYAEIQLPVDASYISFIILVSLF